MKAAQDIISLPIEMNEKIADTKFRLVHIASQRVRQLSGGAEMLVATKSIKDATISLEESLLGRFKVITGEAAVKAKEEFRKREEQAKIDEQLSAKEEEIRKELSAYLSETQSDEAAEGAEGADIEDEKASEESEDSGDVKSEE